MKKQLLTLIIFLTACVWAFGQGNEPFTNYPETANAYHDGTILGLDDSKWTYKQCRGDSVITAPSPTLGKARNPMSKILTGTLHNGCGTLQFDYKQPFTTHVNLNILVNGLLVGNVVSTTQGALNHSGPITVNAPGDFTILLQQADSLNSGQVTVDNVVWTAYSGGPVPEPTNYPTAFTATPSPFNISLTWTDATGAQLPIAYLILASDQNNITAPVDGTPVSDDPNLADGHGALNILKGVQHAAFGSLPSNKKYYFKIFPYTNSGALINYKTDGTAPSASATTPPTTIIDSIHFTNKTFSNWIVKNVTGAQVWSIDSIHLAGNPFTSMSGYAGGANNVNEDWLISPAMNFNLYNNEALSFVSAYKYTGAPLECLISNDYDGVTNPGDFTWTALAPAWSAGNFVWAPSGNVNVSGTSGTHVYIGFKYTSDATAASTWELDDIVITGDLIQGVNDHTARENSFSVSPNPASGKCSLIFSDNNRKEVKVLSMLGAVVLETSTDLQRYSMNISSMPAGIYFVQVYSPATKTTEVKKLIVQ